MNAEWIITNFVIMDDLMMHLDHHSHPLAQVPDSEILIIAVVAAKYFANHHERSGGILQQLGYLSGRISVSRFNRRLHALADWMAFMPQTWGRCGPRAKFLSSTRCPCPCVGASERVVVARCVGGSTAAIARPSKRNSSVGVYSWSVPRRACRFPSSSCRGPCTI